MVFAIYIGRRAAPLLKVIDIYICRRAAPLAKAFYNLNM
jgi:hypothetical protein